MKEQIFSFLTYQDSQEEKGKNGFRINLTDQVRQDPSILGEYLQYGLRSNRRIKQKVGPGFHEISVSFKGAGVKKQSDFYHAANVLAQEIVKSDPEKEIEAVYVEDDFKTPDEATT